MDVSCWFLAFSRLWEFPKTWLIWTWLFAIFTQKHSFALFCALSRAYALFCGPAFALRAQILKKFKILKFSSEIEIFKRATHQPPIFCGEFWRSRLKFSSEIEIFKRDWKFQARLNFFKIWALRVRAFALICALLLRTRRPCTGVKIPKIGKRGFGVKKLPFPNAPENGDLSQKIPFLYRAPQRKWGFLDSKRPFLGRSEMGVFRPRNPLFPILGTLTPEQGRRVCNPFALICVFLRPTAFRTGAFGNCRRLPHWVVFRFPIFIAIDGPS